MTDNEIIKALEICENYKETCEYCPYDNIRHCADEIRKDALNLIKRQQAEIDKLKTEKDNLIKTYAECQIDFLKVFVEKLNSGFLRDHIYNGSYVLGLIEAIAKGMVGDDNA